MPSGDEVFSLVIFGASGDLTNRKLLPALWSLYSARTLPEPFAIIGTARSEMTDEAFRAKMKDGVKQFARLKVPSDNVWDRFAASAPRCRCIQSLAIAGRSSPYSDSDISSKPSA